MRFEVSRDGDNYHVKMDGEDLGMLDRESAVKLLIDRGNHAIDVFDFVRFADRRWLQDHPDEPDPGAFFHIGKHLAR
jgi:hypothetical protein